MDEQTDRFFTSLLSFVILNVNTFASEQTGFFWGGGGVWGGGVGVGHYITS